ncbi:hypothetical protein [Terriglobus aquaticus]|uniref:Uncharacterized protein n=1 Tax=Terriglobus aquaticus TaxID=940139 RepID=A0ABW9KK07_9BACT|nr:hypothetical protein [Terriglobus aquaticus]
MSKVFLANGNGAGLQLERIQCRNETTELQERLLHQPGLLAGDQIDPLSPRKWLLIRREMPVVNPSTGTTDFSLDFLYSDQDGTPTFVEAKRCNDPRARREVIGQMLEYAANGKAYWSADDIKCALLHTHKGELANALRELERGFEDDIDGFCTNFISKVRSGNIRLIFFLEQSSNELRTLAEYLNDQFTNVEVMVVEARQYSLPDPNAGTVIVPRVVGFSEAVRITKEAARADKAQTTIARGEANFWQNIEGALTAEQVAIVRHTIAELSGIPDARVTWIVSAVFLLARTLPKRGLFGIRKDGSLEIYLAYWRPENYPDITEAQASIRDRFIDGMQQLGFNKVNQNSAYPLLKPNDWLHKADVIVALVRSLETLEQASAPARNE